ncbi:MAG: heme-binding protein [Gemmataceae bacterium]|nr:heme-binding protein [Gemmataceae bacterium]
MIRIAGVPLFALAVGLVLGTGAVPAPLAAHQKKDPPKKAPPVKKEVAQPGELYAAPGFQVELLHISDPGTEGSWINLATEKPGKLIIGGQGGQPILRVTIKDGKVDGIEKLNIPITEAMGFLYAYGSLYVNGSGPKGYGLYRCKEGADGKFDVQPLKIFGSGGEHGAHGLALGKDGKIYVMNGNHTKVPDGLAPNPPYRDYQEDHVLPRQWDGNGHAAGIYAPGGYVVRLDPEGKSCELVLGGFRNAYDLAFNADGELFTFDSDMEWDWGMPWYRPTRVNHCTVGSEHGWRSGTGVWPDYYPDNLPPTVNVGIGSPTGVTFGAGAKFPAKYQKAFFMCDWTYGRLFAVHLTPKGASYTATVENFVAPLGLVKPGAPKKPLNLTDVVVGSDGALYFTIGGRNAQAALYRVTYTGTESTVPAALTDKDGAEARALRHKLEAFHGKKDPHAVETAWPVLGSDDRVLRFAARVAVESQPVDEWKTRAVAETNPAAALTALLALARYGDAKTQPDLLAALDRFPLAKLTDDQKLEKLRVLQVSFVRHGPPPGNARKIIAELDPAFPGPNELVNRETFQLLVYLNAPGVVGKGLKQMAAAKTQPDMFHYLFHLRTAPIGSWTLDQRKEYLGYWTNRKKLPQPAELVGWFEQAGRGYDNGASFNNFLKNFLREAVANMSAAEQKELAPTIAAINKDITPSYDTKPRAVVKQWTMDEVLPTLEKVGKGRNFDRGKEAFAAAQCVKCHRFVDQGGSIGPDLTALSSRFGRKEVLESILEPSKVLSDQYQNETFRTLSGKTVTGRVVDVTKDAIAVQPDPLSPDRVTIQKDDIETRTVSKVSPMPANLADVLTHEELLDLIAYLESAGRKNHPVFQK